MQFFDITDLPMPADAGLVKRLGFKKILNNKVDINIVEKVGAETEKPFLISTSNPTMVYNLISMSNSIGVLAGQNELNQKILDKIRENGRVVVFDSCHMISNQEMRIAELHRMKGVFRLVHRSKVGSAMISLASRKEYLLSSIQLLEVAKMITGGDTEAKQMLINLGEIVDDIQKKE
jgi:hypothetical protein